MLGLLAAEWYKCLQQEFDSLIANDKWTLIKVEDVKTSYLVLFGNLVLK